MSGPRWGAAMAPPRVPSMVHEHQADAIAHPHGTANDGAVCAVHRHREPRKAHCTHTPAPHVDEPTGVHVQVGQVRSNASNPLAIVRAPQRAASDIRICAQGDPNPIDQEALDAIATSLDSPFGVGRVRDARGRDAECQREGPSESSWCGFVSHDPDPSCNWNSPGLEDT